MSEPRRLSSQQIWSSAVTTSAPAFRSATAARTRDSLDGTSSPASSSGCALIGIAGMAGLFGQIRSTRFPATGTMTGGATGGPPRESSAAFFAHSFPHCSALAAGKTAGSTPIRFPPSSSAPNRSSSSVGSSGSCLRSSKPRSCLDACR